MKKCPYCAEEIQDDAIKCRFCGENLKRRKRWKNCLIGCLIAFVVSILLIILFIYFGFLILRLIMHKVFFGIERFPYPPFTGPGLEYMFRDFSEFFRSFWDWLRELFRIGTTHKVI